MPFEEKKKEFQEKLDRFRVEFDLFTIDISPAFYNQAAHFFFELSQMATFVEEATEITEEERNAILHG